MSSTSIELTTHQQQQAHTVRFHDAADTAEDMERRDQEKHTIYGASSFTATTTAIVPNPAPSSPPPHHHAHPNYHRTDLIAYLVVALGGTIGSLIRYALSTAFASWDKLESYVTAPKMSYSTPSTQLPRPTSPSFIPLSTFLSNIIGCLLIGMFASSLNDPVFSQLVSTLWRPMLLTGVCGGLTTYSSLVFETIELCFLAREIPRDWWQPLLNILLHHIVCLTAVAVTYVLTQRALVLIPAWRRAKEEVEREQQSAATNR